MARMMAAQLHPWVQGLVAEGSFRPAWGQRLFLMLALAACLLLGPQSSRAALGARVASVPDAAPLARTNSQRHGTDSGHSAAPAFAEHTYTQSSGTTIREFVNVEGLVFAVAWRGAVLPDFQALLGAHFDALKAQAEHNRASRKRGAPISIQTDELVLSSRGRSRQFSGYAYLPAMVPEGLDIKDVLR